MVVMTNDIQEALQSNLQRAVETHSENAINALNKSEVVFYLSIALGTETPEDHPSEYDGQVSRETLLAWAHAVGQENQEVEGDD